MLIGVVEKTSSNKWSDFFEEFVHSRVEQSVVKKFKASDEFDALALLNKTKDMKARVLIIELNKEEPEKETAFYEALANWEAENGLTVFKAIFYNDEEPEPRVKELAENFIEKTYKVRIKEEEQEEEDEELGFELPSA